MPAGNFSVAGTVVLIGKVARRLCALFQQASQATGASWRTGHAHHSGLSHAAAYDREGFDGRAIDATACSYTFCEPPV